MAKRRRFRARVDRFELRSSGWSGASTVVRRVSWAEGSQMCADGQAELQADDATGVQWFRLRVRRGMPKCEDAVRASVSEASRAVPGGAEMRAMAGEFGRSRTAGLSEERKAARVEAAARRGMRLDYEDFVERAGARLAGYVPGRNEVLKVVEVLGARA